VPDSCYRRRGFSVKDSRRPFYGDQGQEVASEEEDFVTRRSQKAIEEHEVPRQVRRGRRGERARRVPGSLDDVGEARAGERNEEGRHGIVS
jgi:hypothetical protein